MSLADFERLMNQFSPIPDFISEEASSFANHGLDRFTTPNELPELNQARVHRTVKVVKNK